MSRQINIDHLKGDVQRHAIMRQNYLENKFPRSAPLSEIFEYQSQLSDRRQRVYLWNGLVIGIFVGGIALINFALSWFKVGWSETTAVVSNLAFVAIIGLSFDWLRRAVWGLQDEGPQTLIEIKAEEEILRLMVEEKMK